MRTVIVPEWLHNRINWKLDQVLRENPEASKDRDIFYKQLLAFYDDYGFVPEFTIQLNMTAAGEP